MEGSGVVDGADEVVVTGERGREVRVACVSRGGRAVSGRRGGTGGIGVGSVLARKILVRLARLSGVTAAARRRRGGSRAPMPSVVRSPANSDILRRVPRARWTLAASTRQYPFSASRVPELSFSAPFAAPRRLGLDDLAATRKVLALARRGRRVPKVENARLRDVTSGNPNPRGAVARRGVEIDASIFAFYFCVIFFFVALPRWGCRVSHGPRIHSRRRSGGARRRDWAFDARCGLVASLRRALCGRSSRLEGRNASPKKGRRVFSKSARSQIGDSLRAKHPRAESGRKQTVVPEKRGKQKSRGGCREIRRGPKKKPTWTFGEFPQTSFADAPRAWHRTRASSFPTQFPNTRAKGCSARARPRSRVPPRREPAVSAAPRDSWSMPRVPRKRN